MAKEAILVAMKANYPTLLVGDPGVGKSSFYEQISRDEGAHLTTIIASIHDPTDFAGAMVQKEDRIQKLPMDWAIDAHERAEAGQKVTVLVDEINTAAPATQAALMRFIHENVIGDLRMNSSIRRVAAMNPPESAAGGWDLAPPLANRMWHYKWSLEPREWTDGITGGFTQYRWPSLEKDWKQTHLPAKLALVAGFIQAKPALLLKLPEGEQSGGAWPSPRSWTMAATLLACAEASKSTFETIASLVQGSVGTGPASEFLTWMKNLDLPDPEDLLADPSLFRVDKTRTDRTYTILASVVSAANSRRSQKRFEQAWTILAKCAEEGSVDVAVPSVKALMKKYKGQDITTVKHEIKKFVPILIEAGLINYDED